MKVKLPDIQKLEMPPTKLHELLAMALEDVKLIERTPGVSVRMDYWARFQRAPGTTCSVCLAGAFLVRHNAAACETFEALASDHPGVFDSLALSTPDMFLTGLHDGGPELEESSPLTPEEKAWTKAALALNFLRIGYIRAALDVVHTAHTAPPIPEELDHEVDIWRERVLVPYQGPGDSRWYPAMDALRGMLARYDL